MDDIGYPRQYDGELDASGPPSILDPRPHGPASRFAERFRGPVRAWAVSTFAGWVVMASLTIGLGLLLVAELLPEGVGAWDRSISSWFVAQRIGTLDTASEVGSMLGSTFVVIGLAVLVGIVLALGRHWLAIGFLAAGLLIEVGAFLAATFAVSRPRPSVPQLDVAPPTSSFPSGHTAAALVLYISVSIIVWTLSDSRVLRALFWSLAVLVPVFVATSRLYRGMHHATDVLGSLVLAAGALACAVAVTRVSAAAASPHRTQVQPSTAPSVEAPAVPA